MFTLDSEKYLAKECKYLFGSPQPEDVAKLLINGGGRDMVQCALSRKSLPLLGAIVDLTPGSISIAVDRLVAKGLVSRVESAEDRRVRIVALTPSGKDLIVFAFRKHSGQMKRVFSELSPEELRDFEVSLKKVGTQAAALMERKGTCP